MSTETQGQIITFYSYKGGTGRTMALTNVASLLAQRQISGNKGVLMIDWDLEAPSLHLFFRELFSRYQSEPNALESHPGLIDLFYEMEERTEKLNNAEIEQTEDVAQSLIDKINFDKYILETDIPNLYLIKAGVFNKKYPKRVNRFNWELLHRKSPWLISLFAQKLAERFRYTLIDSRTGITDTSGICTMMMPEKLVAVFTPNRQSVTGIFELVKQAVNYRRQSADIRPLILFPLPSRIDLSKESFQKDWRYGNPAQNIQGYQPQFEELAQAVYQLPHCNLSDYFDQVQIQYVSDYAYGEKIAVLADRTGGRLDLSQSFINFTELLVKYNYPWEETGTENFDVFFFYDRMDTSDVIFIAEKLKNRGLNLWIDTEQLAPGRRFSDAIQNVLPKTKSVAIFIGKKSQQTWRKNKIVNFVSRSVETNIPVIPVLLPGVHDVPKEMSFLNDLQHIQFSNIDDEKAMDSLEWGITGKFTGSTSKSGYKNSIHFEKNSSNS